MELTAYKGNEPYIFISYAHADSERVLPIVAAMQKKGFRLWFDQGVEFGSEWSENIAEHLMEAEMVLIFMSQAAAQSRNCRNEVMLALEKSVDPLVIYLEEVELSSGLKLQINNLQAMFFHRQENEESAIEKICDIEGLKSCREVIKEKETITFSAMGWNITWAVILCIVLFFLAYRYFGWQFLGFRLDGRPMQTATASSELPGDEQKVTFKGVCDEYDGIADMYYRKSDGIVYAMDLTYIFDYSEYPDVLKTPESKQKLISDIQASMEENMGRFGFMTSDFRVYGNELYCVLSFRELDNNDNAKVLAKQLLKSYDYCSNAVEDDYRIPYDKLSEAFTKEGLTRQ